MTPLRTEAQAAALTELRAGLRGALRGAWSREAVRRGIGAVRGGDYEAAMKCYQQVT